VQSIRLRYLVTVSAVMVGIGWAAWDFSTIAPTLPAPSANAPREMPPEVSRAIFDACVTFYGCVYGVGKAGYRLLRRRQEAEELRRWSRWHMWVLNGVGGAWLCASSWQSLYSFNLIRPAAVVGAILFAHPIVSAFAAAARVARRDPADT
jgi:hypothetical protein